MNAYTIATTAQRTKTSSALELSSSSGLVFAVSHEEATGKAIKASREQFPASVGYYNHAGVANALPDWAIDKIAKMSSVYALLVAQQAFADL